MQCRQRWMTLETICPDTPGIMSTDSLHRLDSSESTLLLCRSADTVSLLWFGPALPRDLDVQELLKSLDLPCEQAKLDQPVPLSLVPMSSDGFLGRPALAAHRDGKHFAPRLSCVSIKPAPADPQSTLVITLEDSLAGLLMTTNLHLDDTSSVLSISTELQNNGTDGLHVEWLASGTIPLPDQFSECLSMHGRWGFEFQQQRHSIDNAQLTIENVAGRTSHEHFPGLVCGERSFCEDNGVVLGLHLAYSGNYRLLTERLANGKAYVQAGAAFLPGEITLDPGTTMTAPMLCVVCASGLNQMSQRFHDYARRHILPAWTRAERPIHANSWEALYFEHSTESLLPLVEAAAAVGAERFVLDDGWFQGRRNDKSGLGDWWVDKDVYPEGLKPLVTHVRKHGMQFGLWFEPEMVNPDSILYREHPEWTLHVEGYETPLARDQLVLNLDLAEVRDYLYDCISVLVKEHSIDYIKWDMNRDLVFPGSNGRASVVRQTEGVYALLQKLTTEFPALEIESCSSGGARADFGILLYTGRVWTSDTIDPIDRLNIQRGFSLFFPPEIMGSHIGHDVAHLTGRSTSLHTRAAVSLQGQMGFELDARVLNEQDREALSPYIRLYKDSRAWHSSSTLWRVPTRDSDLFIQGRVSAQQENSIWTIVTRASLASTIPERFVFKGLAPQKRYHVQPLQIEHIAGYAKKLPTWATEGTTLSGSSLMSTGLVLPVMPAQSSLVVLCDVAP